MNAPADLLAPVGWVCKKNDPDEIRFEHEEWPSVVRAKKESQDRWRVEMTESAGEAESTQTVGYACTRDAALNALSTSMSAMNRVADRTGVVRTMMASSLALYGDADVRGVAPQWRATDRPFERQVTDETPRDPWRATDAGAGAAEASDAGGDATAAEEANGDDAGGGTDVGHGDTDPGPADHGSNPDDGA